MLTLIVIYALLFVSLSFPAIILIYTPWSIAWRMWLVTTISVLSYNELTFIKSMKNFNNLDLQISIYFFSVTGLVLVFRGIYRTIYKKPKPSKSSKFRNKMDRFIALYFGFILSLFIIRFLAYYFAQHNNGYLIHSLIGIGSLITAIILLSFIYLKNYINLLLLNIALISTFLFVSLASFSGMYYPEIVLADAKEKAQGRAYCIDLDRRKRAVTSKEDLTLFTMDKRGGDRNAALLIEKDGEFIPYHWSYWKQTFIKGINNWNNENKPAIACKPRQNFADNLPIIITEKPPRTELYFKDKFLIIPSSYNPFFSGNSIYVSASAPDFKPVPHKKFKMYPSSVEMRSKQWMENLLIRDKNKKEQHYQPYYKYDQNGKIVSITHCYENRSPAPNCQHWFYRDGKMYSFDHDKKLLPNSQQMEESLYNLFKSFGLE